MLPRRLVQLAKDRLCVRGSGNHRAKKILFVSLLLAMFTGVGLRAQTFSLISSREPVASLDGLWRFHTGDNPAWADPKFDDSSWPLIRSGESWTRQGYPAFNGYGWYRFKIEVPGDGRTLDLLLTEIANGYQVYADGKLIGSAGSSVPTGDPLFVGRRTIFPLPAVTGEKRAVQIALRVWTYLPVAYWAGVWTLGPSDHLTFVSDGVVEARNPSGELYGFARTKSISGQPAEAIARTAQSFGQEDDITVLTVARIPKLEEVTA